MSTEQRLKEVISTLRVEAEAWRVDTNDPYNMNYTISTTLEAVADCIEKALNHL